MLDDDRKLALKQNKITRQHEPADFKRIAREFASRSSVKVAGSRRSLESAREQQVVRRYVSVSGLRKTLHHF